MTTTYDPCPVTGLVSHPRLGFTITGGKKSWESSSRRPRDHYFCKVEIRRTIGIVVRRFGRSLQNQWETTNSQHLVAIRD